MAAVGVDASCVAMTLTWGRALALYPLTSIALQWTRDRSSRLCVTAMRASGGCTAVKCHLVAYHDCNSSTRLGKQPNLGSACLPWLLLLIYELLTHAVGC